MLKYIFSVLLIAAVWTTVLLLEFPIWIAIVATAVILLILATIIIYKIVKAKRAAKEIERALKAQADAHAAVARPDLRADIDAMQGEFMQAVAALKTSKLGGKKASEALYALPWYMIIGPPGSGKSTALRNSGLRFPYLSKSGGGVQGVGGTRNCQWWMTNEAVILDTAGRYTTEDADRDEWMAFLDLLKKNRAKQPVNGVLVAIAVTDLCDAHPEEVLARAREIRARVDEVMSKLEMVVPVYVLFTKCDLLSGFVESFSDLGNEDRSQIWGFTVPVTKKQDPAAVFNEHFNELAGVLERRALRRMTEERRAEARDKIYEFWQYFEPLRENLMTFVGEMMAESIYTESPIFRGAYFTSGTQEGRPIDRIMNSMAEAFGIQPQIQQTQPQVEAKSYFLGQVFSKVIFPDKNVATRSAAKLRRQALIGHGVALGLVLLAVGLAVLPVLSFRNNREFLTVVRDSLEKVAEHYAAQTSDPIEIEQIDPLRATEGELRDHDEDGIPLMMRMGMYQGKLINTQIRDLYIKTAREQLVSPIHNLNIQALKRFLSKYQAVQEQPKQEEHDEFKARLRMYLLLTGVKSEDGEPSYPEGEPGIDEKQNKWLTERIVDDWAEPLKLAGDMATRGSMEMVASAYVAILAGYPGYLFERDKRLVESLRRILRRTDRTEALLAELIRDLEVQPLSLRQLTDTKGALKNDGKQVAAAYTANAWVDHIRDRLDMPLDELIGEEWVLGRTEDQAKESKEKQVIALKSLYFDNYIAEWKGFLGSIYVEAPSGYVEARNVFVDLRRGDPQPLKRLCRNVRFHTNLQEEQPSEEEQGLIDTVKDEAGKAAAKKGKKGKLAKKAAALAAKKKEKRDPRIKTREDVKIAFEGLAEFGSPPPAPPVAEGQPPPPPAPVPIDTYQEELAKVGDALDAKIDHEGPEETKALIAAVKAARSSVDALINETDAKGWNQHLSKWLKPPFNAVWRLAEKSSGADITAQWCDEVVRPFRKIQKRYPFIPVDKGREISIPVLAAFLKPESGSLWKYYGTALASRVHRKHNTYSLVKTGSASRTNINPAVVPFLNRAQDLTNVLFPTGSDAMLVEFDVYISDNPKAANTDLIVDGKKITHQNGPGQWLRMQWPGEDDPKGGFLRTYGFGVSEKVERAGNWGFFQLLEKGSLTSGSALEDIFVVKWDLTSSGAGIVKMKFKPVEEDTPFFGVRSRGVKFMDVFRHPQLNPPASIISGGPACGGG